MELKVPDRIDIGGTELVELGYLQLIFGISRRTARKYLRALRIKPMYIGKRVFFSLPTFKRILYVLSKPGSPGFLFPASAGKTNPRLIKDNPNYITEVTDEILRRASDPIILAEMAAADGRDMSILKKLISTSNLNKEKPE